MLMWVGIGRKEAENPGICLVSIEMHPRNLKVSTSDPKKDYLLMVYKKLTIHHTVSLLLSPFHFSDSFLVLYR